MNQNWGHYGQDEEIYILPRGAEADQYLVIYPARLEQELRRLILTGTYSIRTYKGLTPDAVEAVKESLIAKGEERLERLKARGLNMFASGTIIAVFGLLNWFIPDPLPMVDELILTFGGAAVALAGLGIKNRGFEEFESRAKIIEGDINGMEVREDPFLSHCAAAIREKCAPPESGESADGVDTIEEESLWLVKYTDVDELITAGTVTEDELVRFFHHLKKLIPLDALSKAEGWGDRDERGDRKRRNRRKRLVQRLRNLHGFSRDALAVYAALYYSCRKDFPV